LSPLDATPVIALPWTPEQEAAHDAKVRQHLHGLVPSEAATRAIHTEHHVLRGAESGAGLLAQAARLGADVIVMGTHGRSGLLRALMGSVAMDVLKHAKVPVVLVHDPRVEAAEAAT
jgi:nucleotide-binding universal stress UspA family protein